jgi:hypothetical protein
MDGLIHPCTGPTFLRSEKSNALEFEFLSDEIGQIEGFGEDVAPGGGGIAQIDGEFLPEFFQILPGEEGDLPFVIGFEIEESVLANPATGYAGEFGNFHHGVFSGWLTVMSEIVVSRRNEEVADHGRKF